MSSPYAWIHKSLKTIHKANWYRSVQAVESVAGPVVMIDAQPMVNFASNDYLGLAGDARLAQKAIAATQRLGTGATGSRLLSGHRQLHRELEEEIARLKGTEDAMVFSSGYLANIGTIEAVVGDRDLILTDEYNHVSLKNGAVLSGATVLTYRHSDMANLAAQLSDHRSRHRRCLILTDGVFGMDGDVCPLPQILELADAHEAMVLVDEAHSGGVLGETGAGCAEYFGLTHRAFIQMGTLSKAFASLGGYVAGDTLLIDFLRNRAPSWIYTTALSPADTAAALAAIHVLKKDTSRLKRLHENAAALTRQLDQLMATFPSDIALKRLPTDSAIVCLQVKDAATVLKLGQCLKENGILTAAVRPPTVPISRLRMSVIATHTQAHIDRLVNGLAQAINVIA
ncbi:MAG: 8-amino-7-oxononanoate synthase [Cyanobacteria bacterium P01_D01_bin.105]